MPKMATKAADNVFYKARIAAASWNDRLGSREGASEVTGIDRTRLANIELGTINPHPEEVLMLSDTYNAPELQNHFCSHLCPLGIGTISPIELEELERVTLQLISAMKSLPEVKDGIIDIAADGVIDAKEKPRMKQYPEEWFAVARTASKPDALQGFHADDILYIIDEASGVDDKVFEPVLGALSTPGARLLMCGNPTQLSGFFYDSHHKNRGSYTTFHVDGRNSSRVSDDFVKTIIQMYGEDSDVFRVRVAGEFPRQENDVFIPLPLVEKSIMTEWTEPAKPVRIDIGCDVARYGDDRTVIGYKVDEKAMFYKRKSGQDLMQTADDIMELGLKLMEKYRFDKAIPIKIDDSGLGGGVTDRLRRVKREQPERFWWMDIIPVYFGQRIHHDFYYDSTTYMMSVVKNLLAPQTPDGAQKPVQLILPNDNDLVGQLSTRKYSMTDDAKIRVESKDAMKKRGMHSPDEADCILLLCLPVKPKRRGDVKK